MNDTPTTWIVDDSGHPIPFFHGTNAVFETFDTRPVNTAERKRLGACFSSNRRFAELYGSSVWEVSLSISNAFDIVELDAWEAISALPVSERLKAELRGAFRGVDFSHYGLLESCQREDLRSALEARGYDGVRYTEGSGDVYVAFKTEQIHVRKPGGRTVLERADRASEPTDRGHQIVRALAARKAVETFETSATTLLRTRNRFEI